MDKARAKELGLSPIEIGPIALVDIQVHVEPELELVDEFTIRYSAKVSIPIEVAPGVYAFRAEFDITKSDAANEAASNVTFVKVTYASSVHCTELADDEVLLTAKGGAHSLMWGAFRIIAALLTNQMGAFFPALPILPDDVGVLDQVPDQVDPTVVDEVDLVNRALKEQSDA